MQIEHYRKMTTGTHALFVLTFGREVWAQWLRGDDTPDCPHPQGRRWGVSVQPGGTTLYVGRIVVTVSRVKRPQADALEAFTAHT
jgi:hypothetical protein